MFHIDNPSGVTVMPPLKPEQSTTPLYFTDGTSGQSPSYPAAEWFNVVQSELLNVLKSAGISPSKNQLTQVADSVNAMINKTALTKNNNLSDVGDVATVLKNLGILSAGLRAIGNGANQIPDMSFFSSSLKTPGYQILPTGLVLQWGTAAVPIASSVTVVYPLALSVGCLQLVSPVDSGLVNNYRVGVAASTPTSITITSTNTASATGVMWFSIGKIDGVKNV